MDMDFTQIGVGALGVACSVLGWFARELYAAIKELRIEISHLERRVAADYVRYDRLKELLQPLHEKLDYIQGALSTKADKP